MALKDDQEDLLRSATDYALSVFRKRLDSISAGEYSFYAEPGKGVETPPHVRAIVLRSKNEKIAIVRADTFLMHEQIVRRTADIIEAETGIEYENILLLGAHNHSAPHASATTFGRGFLQTHSTPGISYTSPIKLPKQLKRRITNFAPQH